MKIAMVSEHASPLAALGGVDAGGQNVHVAALAAALARRGHTVTVYTRRDTPLLPTTVRLQPGVAVRHLPAGPAQRVPKDDLLPYVPELSAGLARDWQRQRPDLVHSHFWMSGLAAVSAARSMAGPPVPVVHTYHALGIVKRRQLGFSDTSPTPRVQLEKQLGREVDAVIATCSDEAFELKAMGIPASKISVAPCGVDLAQFTPNGTTERRSPRHRIAVVGRMVPRKGLGLVITAVKLLSERGRDDVELQIIGGVGTPEEMRDDPEAQRLAKLADEAGIRDRVTFRGQLPQTELPAVLRSLDAVVCAPWYEPFGIVPLEAMACGVPVIAATVGGLIDTVVDGVTGIHVPPRDPAAIAWAIEQIIDHPDQSAALGAAGRQRVCALYSWNRVARETERVYRDLATDVKSTALPQQLEGGRR